MVKAVKASEDGHFESAHALAVVVCDIYLKSRAGPAKICRVAFVLPLCPRGPSRGRLRKKDSTQTGV